MTTFTIYFVRHGLAGQFGDYSDDTVRPLTSAGQAKTRKVAERLKALDVKFDRILSSPYIRAHQTATILQSAKLGSNIETADFLQPEQPFAPLLEWLEQVDRAQTVAIVGHEPNLSTAAEELVFGQPIHRLVLKKAGVIALDAPAQGDLRGHCGLRWLLAPKILL
jgi:phosphohistidine phosphatase